MPIKNITPAGFVIAFIEMADTREGVPRDHTEQKSVQ